MNEWSQELQTEGLTAKTKTKNANMSIIRGIVLHNCKRARCGCDLRAMVLVVVVLLFLNEKVLEASRIIDIFMLIQGE